MSIAAHDVWIVCISIVDFCPALWQACIWAYLIIIEIMRIWQRNRPAFCCKWHCPPWAYIVTIALGLNSRDIFCRSIKTAQSACRIAYRGYQSPFRCWRRSVLHIPVVAITRIPCQDNGITGYTACCQVIGLDTCRCFTWSVIKCYLRQELNKCWTGAIAYQSRIGGCVGSKPIACIGGSRCCLGESDQQIAAMIGVRLLKWNLHLAIRHWNAAVINPCGIAPIHCGWRKRCILHFFQTNIKCSGAPISICINIRIQHYFLNSGILHIWQYVGRNDELAFCVATDLRAINWYIIIIISPIINSNRITRLKRAYLAPVAGDIFTTNGTNIGIVLGVQSEAIQSIGVGVDRHFCPIFRIETFRCGIRQLPLCLVASLCPSQSGWIESHFACVQGWRGFTYWCKIQLVGPWTIVVFRGITHGTHTCIVSSVCGKVGNGFGATCQCFRCRSVRVKALLIGINKLPWRFVASGVPLKSGWIAS